MVIPKIRTCGPEKLAKIKQVIKEWKPQTKKEIAILVGCSEDLIEKVLRTHPIDVPSNIRRRPVEEIVQEIQDEYREKQVISMILPYIREVIKRNLSESEKLGYEDLLAINAKLKRKMTNPWTDVFTALKRYHEALRTHQRVPLRDLVEGLSLSSQDLSRYLKYAGRESIGLNYDRKSLSIVDRSRLKRAFNIKMSVPDISYFLDSKNYLIPTVSSFFRNLHEKGLRRPKIKQCLKRFGTRKHPLVLTYRICSQIYECRDAEFSPKESMEYSGINNELYDYALAHEQEIAPEIIEAIQTLFLYKNHKDPYLN